MAMLGTGYGELLYGDGPYGGELGYAPDASLLLGGDVVDFLDLVDGLVEASPAQSFVQVPVGDPARDPAVTVRPTRVLRGRLTAHLTRSTWQGTPAERADRLLQSLLTGAPHTLRFHDEPGLTTDYEIVPAGVPERRKAARSLVWTVAFEYDRVLP